MFRNTAVASIIKRINAKNKEKILLEKILIMYKKINRK